MTWINAYEHFGDVVGPDAVEDMCLAEGRLWNEGDQYKYIDGVLHVNIEACRRANRQFMLHHMGAAINKRTALYRHYDECDRLLYLGISLSPVRRLIDHQRAGWFDQIDRIEIEWFDCRESALKAEVNAIQSEKPLNNIAHNAAEH